MYIGGVPQGMPQGGVYTGLYLRVYLRVVYSPVGLLVHPGRYTHPGMYTPSTHPGYTTLYTASCCTCG